MSRISIDLGTSNTQIACLDTNRQPKNIGEIIPTVLYVDNEQKRIHVGQAAVYAYESAVDAKKEDANSFYLDNFKTELCLAQVNPDDLTVLTGVDGKLMTWLEVLTACFSYFRSYAMEYEFAGAEVNEAVLTHPVNFPNIELYRQSALEAGFKNVYFVQEPEAAYHGYKFGGRNLGNKVLVFDMGGGTLDVALLEEINGAWSVRSQPLRLDTAGYHIDLAICESLQDELREADLISNPDDVASFIKYAREQIKEPLGSGTLASARIKYTSDVTNRMLKSTYPRERFYRVLDKMLVPVFHTIEEYVNKLPDAPDTVLMVGGSSRLRYVKDKLEKLFAGINVFSPADGGSLVAKGGLLAPAVVLGAVFERTKNKLFGFLDILRKGLENEGNVVSSSVLSGNAKKASERHIDINKPDQDGWTPLMHAVKRGLYNRVGELMQKGAYIDAVTPDGQTVLHIAARYNQERIANLFLRISGFDVNKKDSQGRTALHVAVENSAYDVIDILVRRPSVNVNAVDKEGKTALIYAVQRDNMQIVDSLLLDVRRHEESYRNGRYMTAVQYARMANKWDIYAYLVQAARCFR